MREYASRKVIKYNDYFKLSPKAHSKGKHYYYDEFITLDTETSSDIHYDEKGNIDKEKSNAWIYQWAMCTKSYIIEGSTLDDLIACILKIDKLSTGAQRKIYVHNLSYDAVYIMQELISKLGMPKTIAVDKRKEIQHQFTNIILCCSYRLSNKGLDKWTKDLNTEHKKLVGYVDYNAKHFPDEKRTNKDDAYMFNDVVSQYEAIEKQLKMYDDTTASVPLTSTGYIRRMMRKSYKAYNASHHDEAYKDFKASKMDEELYQLHREEFAGALTHGNRFYANRIVRTSKKLPYGRHRDFDSHYPTQQLTKLYPHGRWTKLYDKSECSRAFKKKDIKKLIDAGKAILMRIIVKDLELKDKSETLPYAQEFKFRQNHKMYGTFDNGRIINMKGESIISVNEVDYYILCKQYNFKMQVLELYTAEKAPLPEWFKSVILDLYKKKTDLKKRVEYLEEHEPDNDWKIFEAKLDLLKVKDLLNAIYGMSATNPVRINYRLDQMANWVIDNDIRVSEILDKFYDSRNNCLQYSWGCWCTSYARFELLNKKDIIESHGGIFLYGDTDSIFYLSNDEVEAALEADDAARRQKAIDNNWSVTLDSGEVRYFDHFDKEIDWKEFKFLHAKCYGLIDINDKLKVTIAGVRARQCIGLNDKDEPIYFTREEELKSLDQLKKGTKFKICGGTSCTYIEKPIGYKVIDGHRVKCGNAAIIRPTEKTLSEFKLKEILEGEKIIKN